MNKYLVDYCEYVKQFKAEYNILIMDDCFTIIHISSNAFFKRYGHEFVLGADVLKCLQYLPCFEIKQQIYDNLVQTKRIFGYIVAQHIDHTTNALIDSVSLSPILDLDKNLIGIELNAVELDGLPLVTLSSDCGNFRNITNINLTEREREIIILKTMGKTNLEISQILAIIYKKEISQHTIANIIKQQIYVKLKVKNKPAMIKAAHALGLDKIIPKSLITENQLILFPSIR